MPCFEIKYLYEASFSFAICIMATLNILVCNRNQTVTWEKQQHAGYIKHWTQSEEESKDTELFPIN